MTDPGDPGWRPALRPWWRFLVPFVDLFAFRRKAADLIGLRHVFVHIGVALAAFALVVPATIGPPRGPPPGWAWLLLGATVAWSAVWIASSRRRLFRPGLMTETLGPRFRALCFIDLGMATAPALWGIGLAIATETRELAYAGVAAGLGLLAWAAPRAGALDRIDDRLRTEGFDTSIREALAGG